MITFYVQLLWASEITRFGQRGEPVHHAHPAGARLAGPELCVLQPGAFWARERVGQKGPSWIASGFCVFFFFLHERLPGPAKDPIFFLPLTQTKRVQRQKKGVRWGSRYLGCDFFVREAPIRLKFRAFKEPGFETGSRGRVFR